MKCLTYVSIPVSNLHGDTKSVESFGCPFHDPRLCIAYNCRTDNVRAHADMMQSCLGMPLLTIGHKVMAFIGLQWDEQIIP